jgi:hypothetical protein
MASKRNRLEELHTEYSSKIQQSDSWTNGDRENTMSLLAESVKSIYQGAYAQQAIDRYANAQAHEKYMHHNQYKLSTQGMLNDIQKAIKQLDGMIMAFERYYGSAA